MHIDSLDALSALYPAPHGRAVKKELDALDRHCRHFVGLSPFVVIASASAANALDASPRGGAPGFVKAVGAHTLLIPDSPGNNRLDTLENIVSAGAVGLLFMIPGIDETLRVNGRARLSTFDAHLDAASSDRRRPKLVIEVTVTQAYLHCAKAFMRSKLWNTSVRQPRDALPTMGQMISDQTGLVVPAETHDDMVARYAPDL